MSEHLKSIPEIFENSIGECIATRNDAIVTFKELGPPDLVHIVKSMLRPQNKEIGSYHFTLGVDTSSSASIAAYINSLTYTIDDGGSWFSRSSWRLTSSTYCCYNAFACVDIRVEANIPGGVKSYIVDASGQRFPANSELWAGAFISSMLRSIHNHESWLVGLRKIDPMTTEMQETRFLETASTLFWNGWQIGADPTIQHPTAYNNHLTLGIFKYFEGCQRLDVAARFFSLLIKKDIDMGAILSRCYLDADQEVKAVEILTSSLLKKPNSYPLLLAESRYLGTKGRSKQAIEIGKEAINFAPSEFTPWANLCSLYIQFDHYEQALITLNSCPMFSFPEHNNLKLPPPAKIRLPRKHLDGLENIADDKVDPILQKLQAPNLRGTFKEAYGILAKLCSAVGWDDLLKVRSRVFVMEEELRKEKKEQNGEVAEESQSPIAQSTADEENNANGTTIIDAEAVQAAQSAAITSSSYLPLPSKKRLCERWLDNLFMILYEDLRVYTIWKAEMNHFAVENREYKRSSVEWEILGELALRVYHTNDAKHAFHECLKLRFSEKGWCALAKIYIEEGKVTHAMNAISNLLIYYDSIYDNIVYPSIVGKFLFKLIRDNGLLKVRSTMISMNLPQLQQTLFQKYFEYAVNFQVLGYNY